MPRSSWTTACLPCGIPVSGACNTLISHTEARQQLGLPADRPLVLLLGGSMGHGSQKDLIDALLARKRFSPHIAVVCGSNEKAKASLEKHYSKRPDDVTILGFEKRVPLLMRAASVTFTKPGGLSSTEAAVDRFHTLAGELRDTEATLSHTSQLMGAVVQYAKTRPVFDGYKAARYSKKYLAQHEAELADYRAAKAAMSELLGGAKLPKMTR